MSSLLVLIELAYLDSRPVGEKVEGVSKQNCLKAGNRLDPDDVGDDLGLLLDHRSVAHGQTVQEVHEDYNDEEDEGEEVEVADRPGARFRGDRDVRELDLADKHGRGLDDRQPRIVKELVILLSASAPLHITRSTNTLHIFVKHNVEAKSKSDEEEGIPDKEGDKSLQDLVEHGDVDVVPAVYFLTTNDGYIEVYKLLLTLKA